MIAICLILAAGGLTIAVALGIQNHNDRILTARMAQSEAELKATGARIATTKDHELKTVFVYRAGNQLRKGLIRRQREGVSIRFTSSIEKTSGS